MKNCLLCLNGHRQHLGLCRLCRNIFLGIQELIFQGNFDNHQVMEYALNCFNASFKLPIVQ